MIKNLVKFCYLQPKTIIFLTLLNRQTKMRWEWAQNLEKIAYETIIHMSVIYASENSFEKIWKSPLKSHEICSENLPKLKRCIFPVPVIKT